MDGLLGIAAPADQVLVAGEGSSIKLGAPVVAGASVSAKVIKQHKDEKGTTFKFRKRKGFHKTRGHRQPLTLVQITAINA